MDSASRKRTYSSIAHVRNTATLTAMEAGVLCLQVALLDLLEFRNGQSLNPGTALFFEDTILTLTRDKFTNNGVLNGIGTVFLQRGNSIIANVVFMDNGETVSPVGIARDSCVTSANLLFT